MGSAEDFDTFYSGTVRRVLHHVYAVCGDLAEAQDAVAEAYARAWQRWSKISEYEDPESWVRTVAWRLAANRWRRIMRLRHVRFKVAVPASIPGPTPDRVVVTAALRRLPEAQRRVVVLHYLYGLTVAQIAASTQMPPGTVKVYLSRARATLARLLGEDEKEDAHVVTHS